MKNSLEKINKEIIKDSFISEVTTDERIIGDDIAQVRKGKAISRHMMNEVELIDSEINDNNNIISMSSSYIGFDRENDEISSLPLLKAAAEAIGLNVDVEIKSYNSSCRSSKPLNEFEDNNFILSGAFPFISMFRNAYNNKTSLKRKHINHLLL